MPFEGFFYWTGATVWTLLLIALVGGFLFLLWTYLSVGLTYWWVRLKAVKQYPNGEVLKPEFMQQRFWKARLLWLIMKDVRGIFALADSRVSSTLWVADYRGIIPHVAVVSFSHTPSVTENEDLSDEDLDLDLDLDLDMQDLDELDLEFDLDLDPNDSRDQDKGPEAS